MCLALSIYARGLSTRDIGAKPKELYGIHVSAEMVSRITDRILPEIKEWQSRPLEPVYPFVFMDAIHYKMREDGRIVNRAAYVVLGVTLEGNKDILSITIGANESSKFWLGMLNDLKNRGVQDVLFFCVDGLPGFREAIKKYPYAISNWESNWDVVNPFFQFSDDIRRIMYTTNIIEGLNRQFRKVTKTKSVFPNDASLEKMLYLASVNVMKKWKMRYRNWDLVLSQLNLLYEDRLRKYL